MKSIYIFIIMAGILNSLTSFNNPNDTRDFQDDKFKVGQIWKYKNRIGEDSSTLTILKIENYDSTGIVIHIYVNGLILKNPQHPNGFTDVVGHLPLSKEAVLKSVTALISSDNKLPDFRDGYNNWKEAFDNQIAGVFSIEVSGAVKYTEDVLNSGQETKN